MALGLRVAATALWIGLLLAMASWSNSDAALAGAVAGTVLLGVLVGRWWVLWVPVVPGAVLALMTLVSRTEDSDGTPSWLWAAYIALATVGVTALLAVGVAISRAPRLLAGIGGHGPQRG